MCARQTQPGFTHWGSLAEFVALDAADVNLVAVPDELDLATAAALGCRYATAFRAVVQVARGAGRGVGGGARLRRAWGSRPCRSRRRPARGWSPSTSRPGRSPWRASSAPSTPWTAARDVPAAVVELTGGGAHVSLDALGAAVTCTNSIRSLRPRGRHVQVGLLPPAQGRPEVPMERVIGLELQVLGSHGMAAHAYPELLGLIAAGRLDPRPLITRRLALDDAGRRARRGRPAARDRRRHVVLRSPLRSPRLAA